ncbi:MAG TPA: 3-deoxy-7-phosphoheptulonate synthase [Bacillota bacterium]|nr:3-deoxy-7-phosphoheptulonate synthase [Bacillota bacterium]
MIVIMNQNATPQQLENVQGRLKDWGFDIHLSQGVERTIIGAIGDKKPVVIQSIESMEGVDRVVPILQPYKLAGREFHSESTQVRVGNAVFGGEQIVVIAGPCAVESLEQLLETAKDVKAAGAHILRGGAFKPRTSPYAFQGLEEEGLKFLKTAREETGMPFVTEVTNPRDVEMVQEYTDMLQIGARNMQNFTLLREVGKARKPVLLKRGLSATIEEWLMAAEYIMSEGNYEVVLCERGIRTFETATRNTFDVSAIPVIKKQSHLPVIADPSHASGKRHLIQPLACAAVAAGADGLMIEVHPDPEHALSDGPQSLTPAQFEEILQKVRPVAEAVGRAL